MDGPSAWSRTRSGYRGARPRGRCARCVARDHPHLVQAGQTGRADRAAEIRQGGRLLRASWRSAGTARGGYWACSPCTTGGSGISAPAPRPRSCWPRWKDTRRCSPRWLKALIGLGLLGAGRCGLDAADGRDPGADPGDQCPPVSWVCCAWCLVHALRSRRAGLWQVEVKVSAGKGIGLLASALRGAGALYDGGSRPGVVLLSGSALAAPGGRVYCALVCKSGAVAQVQDQLLTAAVDAGMTPRGVVDAA